MSTLNPKWIYADQALSGLKDAVHSHPKGQSGWAKDNGFSAAYVSDVCRGKRDISDKMANALCLQRMVVFYEVKFIK